MIDTPHRSVHGRRPALQPLGRPLNNTAQENRQAVRRNSSEPFQESTILQSAPTDCHEIVVTGDFFQLPPVTQGGKDVFFAFQSDAWKESIERTVTLTQVFRQKDSGKLLSPGTYFLNDTHITSSNRRLRQPSQRTPPRRDPPSNTKNASRPIQTPPTRRWPPSHPAISPSHRGRPRQRVPSRRPRRSRTHIRSTRLRIRGARKEAEASR